MNPGPAATGTPGAAGPDPRDEHWSTRGACRRLHPDFMFEPTHRAESVHICNTHCPVLDQCRAYADSLRRAPTDCVMAGRTYRAYHDRIKKAPGQPDTVDRCRLCPRGEP